MLNFLLVHLSGPRKVAENVRNKIERFKLYMPLLLTVSKITV